MLFGFGPTFLIGFILQSTNTKIKSFNLTTLVTLWATEKVLPLLLGSLTLSITVSMTYSIFVIYILSKKFRKWNKGKLILSTLFLFKQIHLTTIFGFVDIPLKTFYHLIWLLFFCSTLLFWASSFKPGKTSYLLLIVAPIHKLLSLLYPILDIHQATIHYMVLGVFSYMAMEQMIGVPKKLGTFILSTIFIGILIRVFFPMISPTHFWQSLHFSMGFWTLGFLIYFLLEPFKKINYSNISN